MQFRIIQILAAFVQYWSLLISTGQVRVSAPECLWTGVKTWSSWCTAWTLAKLRHIKREKKKKGRGEEDQIVNSSPVSFSAPAQRAACTGSYTPPADNTEITISVISHSHTLLGVLLQKSNEWWVVWCNLTSSGLTFPPQSWSFPNKSISWSVLFVLNYSLSTVQFLWT